MKQLKLFLSDGCTCAPDFDFYHCCWWHDLDYHNNEGGNETQYNNITWKDDRPKPTWAEIEAVCDTFAAQDLQQYRESLECGPLQIRRALRSAGYKQDVQNWLATADEDTVEDWQVATVFKRLDPMVLAVQSDLGLTDEEVDSLFELGRTLA